MTMKPDFRKLIGPKEERAVSPVIGVILMVAITVILAAVIAAFVLDIGPGETDPTGEVDIINNGTDSVDVELITVDSSNTDGVALVADENIPHDGDGDDVFNDGDVVATLSTTGEVTTVDDDVIDEAEDGSYDFTVRAYAGTVESADSGNEDTESIDDQADGQAIIDRFTFVQEE